MPCVAAETRGSTYLKSIAPADLFPGADRFGPADARAPAFPVYKGDTLLGYAYLTTDLVDTTGYSGRPIDVMVGLTPDGVIAGAKLMAHHEPIVLVGIPVARVEAFIAGYIGRNVFDPALSNASAPPVDIVSGATVTVMVIGDSLLRSGRKLAGALALAGSDHAGPAQAARTIDMSRQQVEDWETLLGDGSVRRLLLTVADVNAAFDRTGRAEAMDRPEPGPEDDTFIDLYAALATIPTIGRSLLGDAEYQALLSRLKPGQQALLLAGRGRYSFKGSGYVRGGIFDRVELVQNEAGVRFRDKNHKRLGSLAAAGAPDLPEIGLFIVPETMTFDPAQPWRLQLLVQRATAALDKSFVTFDLSYLPPETYLQAAAPAPAQGTSPAGPLPPAAQTEPPAEIPLWQRIWENRAVDITLTLGVITLVTAIFFFQDMLVRRPVLYGRVRTGVLLFTLLFLGWYAHAQLSVVNVLTFVDAMRHEFRWDYFMMDPLLFLLWFAVAASLLFWGRGAFCGWLCPFGALQELSNKAARRLKLPQVKVPFALHERLWPIKYIIFLVIFGLSLHSLAMAEMAAEVEPFKTAIILHFVRDWWFVLFAGVLLLAGLFIERFFCRYLCPLGAALAIPGRMRMFNWLRRYRECGNPCHRCAVDCPVQAIHPDGRINPNECIQCLHCQVLYHHTQLCPVVVGRLKKAERRAAALTSNPSLPPAVKAATAIEPPAIETPAAATAAKPADA
ncbi:NosR/NirI family protein [Oleisolibacter albus]|uniref:NosR/NirI family protein n=1 Tax=Oleisolibacter albus TaxID=2171757 RepID=UPI000DF1C390|nr:NosR/NirI family protein [Oleisolibacter albus]